MGLTQLLIYSLFFGLFIGALWQPVFGILGYISVYLIYNPEVWWGNALLHYLPRPSFIAMTFLIIGSIIHAKRLDWSFSRREVELYLFLGLIWLISFVFGIGVQDDNWTYIVKMTKLFVFIFLLIRISNSMRNYKLVVWMFIIGALFLSYQSYTAYANCFFKGRLEFLGGMDFGESNGIAAMSATALFFLGFEILRVQWWKKILYLIGIAAIMHTIILTQSRGVFIGIFLIIPYIFLWAPSKYRKIISISAILGVLLFFILTDTGFINRMKTSSEELQYDQENTLTRLDFWRASIRIFKDHPLGIGVKNFAKLVPKYDDRNQGMDAHNTYVICYSELGIPGIVLFLIIIAEVFLQLRRIRLMVMDSIYSKEIILYVLALGAVIIVYLTGYGMTHTVLYKEIFWMLLSLPICLENISRKLLSEDEYNQGEI